DYFCQVWESNTKKVLF
nr:immunoglobulin light chain junction region [Macaca mulatta]